MTISKKLITLITKLMYIPTRWLKDVSDVGGSVLARVWKEEILLSKYFPNKLKLADVKKNDKNFVEYYRPVSVLPTVSKMFDRTMQKYVSDYNITFSCRIFVDIEKDSSNKMHY